MNAQHTPGPWLREGNTIYALTQDGWRKGEAVMVNRFMASVSAMKDATPEEAEANAAIIQAAPDMLSAIESALVALSHPRVMAYVPDGVLVEMESAIAKAKPK